MFEGEVITAIKVLKGEVRYTVAYQYDRDLAVDCRDVYIVRGDNILVCPRLLGTSITVRPLEGTVDHFVLIIENSYYCAKKLEQ